MRPECSDDVDDFAAGLFAAAREERPRPPLLERVLRASQEAEAGVSDAKERPDRHPIRLGETPRQRRRPSLGWVALAAALPVAAAVATLLRAPGEAPHISREDARPTRHGPEPSSPSRPASEPAPSTFAEPVPAAPETQLEAPEAPLRDRSAPARATPPAPERAIVPEAAPEATPIPLSNELDLLRQARQALRQGEAERALTLLDQYDSRRGTTLVAEATLLRIESFSSLGQTGAARELAQRFVHKNPDSPLVDRARSFIGATEKLVP